MGSLADRLKIAMAMKGTNQTKIGEAVGLSQAAIQKLVVGKSQSSSKIEEIAKFLGVNRLWLEHGVDGNVGSGDFGVWSVELADDKDSVEIPLLTDSELVSGSYLNPSPDNQSRKIKFAYSTLRRLGVDPCKAACVSVKGDSMEPVLRDGSMVGVDVSRKEIIDGKMFAVSIRGLLKIKVLTQLSSTTVRVKSYNSDEYPDEDVNMSDINVEGWIFWSASTY